MKAVVFHQYGPPEVLQRDNLTRPHPGDGEVLVKVHASSVNPLDWKLRRRIVKIPRPGFPQVVAFDLSGVVEAIGREVTHLSPGDAVYGLLNITKDGAAAEYAVTQAHYLVQKPEELSHQQAAAMPMAGLTALQSLKVHAKLTQGERILVVGGSGGVGHFAVACAKAFGAHVTATTSRANVKMVEKLGADEVIAYDESDIPDDAEFDIIFDTVKAYDFASARRWLTPSGRYIGTEPDVMGLAKTKITRLFGNKQKCLTLAVQPDPQALAYLNTLVRESGFRPVIQEVFPIREMAAAQALSEAGHVAGKLVLDVIDGWWDSPNDEVEAVSDGMPGF